MSDLTHYDIVIVGGGLAGMAAALGLARSNFKICLLEQSKQQGLSHPSYDDRTLVVNRASINFWKNLGVWQHLIDDIAVIDKVHVSNRGHFGSVVFDKESLGVDKLAGIVEAKVLGSTLRHLLEKNANIELLCPVTVTEFHTEEDHVEVFYENSDQAKHTLTAKLMLAADGARSLIREQLKLTTEIRSYQRTAVICNITPEFKHQNCAFERLTETGPTALLPFRNNRCGFVWTLKTKDAEEVLRLSDEAFIERAQTQFGYRLGRFIKIGERSSYPLYFVEVPKQVKSRVILLGNAAHSMSPVSAQGLNLAVRDVAALVAVVDQARIRDLDIGEDRVIENYQSLIIEDQKATMRYTDDLMKWFAIKNPMITALRSCGLVLLDQLQFIKYDLFSNASGFRNQDLPILLRNHEKI